MNEINPPLEPLTFTRYLYPKIYVKHSLFIALLEHQYEESLFWAYELYYSGFQKELFLYIIKLFEEVYSEVNEFNLKFADFIHTSYYEIWQYDNNNHAILGTIVGTISHMDYKIDNFMKTYYNINCFSKLKNKKSKKNMIISCKPEDIIKYDTCLPIESMYKYLRQIPLYPIRTNIKILFQGEYENIKNMFYYDWLYYASGSPIWKKRIEEFNGIVNNNTRKIEFETEDFEESFYNTWGLEPDEQPQLIQDLLIGIEDVEQVCIKDFCENFGSPIVTKTVKKKNVVDKITI